MRIIFASDSFKGTLSSYSVNAIEIAAAEEIFGAGDYISLEMADGGEGTLSAIERSVQGYERVTCEVTGPLGEPLKASFLSDETSAVVEMAEASGLTLVPEERRNPLHTTSYGTGELIRAAIEAGAEIIYIGIGGSATNDGGIGAMRALGFRFTDIDGQELDGYGRDLINIASIDDSEVMKEVPDCTFIVMCDVKNPLTGPNGATHTFGPQKGAKGAILEQLEAGMQNYLKVLEDYSGRDLGSVEGLGAAGGLGAALHVLLKGRLQSGVETVLDLADFDAMLEGADAVISGEGRTDRQTLNGKVVYGIAKRCKEKNVPLYVISGSTGDGIEELYDIGVSEIIPCITENLTMEEIKAVAERKLKETAERFFAKL